MRLVGIYSSSINHSLKFAVFFDVVYSIDTILLNVNGLFTIMSNKYLSNSEIIERLKKLYDVSSDNALAEILEVSRQSIYQFKKGQEADIKVKIICDLLDCLYM